MVAACHMISKKKIDTILISFIQQNTWFFIQFIAVWLPRFLPMFFVLCLKSTWTILKSWFMICLKEDEKFSNLKWIKQGKRLSNVVLVLRRCNETYEHPNITNTGDTDVSNPWNCWGPGLEMKTKYMKTKLQLLTKKQI